jgi:hypothetical protein
MSERQGMPAHGALPYIVAVVIMSLFGVVGILVLTIMRPTQDNTTLIALIVGFLTPTTVSLLALMKAQETHLSVNSRLDQFVASEKDASHAEGVLIGQAMSWTGHKGAPGETGRKGAPGEPGPTGAPSPGIPPP